MIKHFLNYVFFACTMFAAGATPLGGGSGAGAGAGSGGAGAGSGGGAGAGGTGGAGAGTGGQGGGAGAGQGSGAQAGQGGQGGDAEKNWNQVRKDLDDLRTKYEPYEKLNLKPDQITQYQTVYTKTFEAAASIGRELGYPDEEIQEALAEDPQRTLDFLRNEAQRMQQGGQRQDGKDLQDLVAQHIEKAIGPIQQRENQRITNEANSLFERTVHSEIAAICKQEGIDIANLPPDEMFMVSSAASEILKYDADALKALKYEGKTAAVQKAVRDAVAHLDKYYLARAGRDRARVNPVRPGQQQPLQTGKRPSLDEMIDNPELIDTAQGRSGANAHYR